MSITLFEHNRDAYVAASLLLQVTGKAAIIHPTGTGKSFIGFQLCEDHHNANICWLSPSEYIFKTQVENLAVTGSSLPENIRFFTYAKLMLMEQDALQEIHPDYIILDEFHRCGAEMWGRGVQLLLSMYPNAPVLGLSATHIRYLDNQRNMADELFEGNIASEMTLGEAIVRGILEPPTYITSVYSYQKDLQKCQERIHRTKSRATQDNAQKYLDALRRALDKAEGLDKIFARHMKKGKYIVFCANVSHMEEMISHSSAWFKEVDSAPKIYRAYADAPDTSEAFVAFKADKSDHLKLLFCIDMLNEGVHVEGIDGVILFRPTVSPIIYKQQIGRALSASKGTHAVIFDIVNNVENLYSIGAIEQEMQIAVAYYRLRGEPNRVVNERFQILDEVQDCKKLFDALNETLSASWDCMYSYAEQYAQANGHLLVPRGYKTLDGYSLGTWLMTQRRVHAGEISGALNETQVQKLDEIGMVWDGLRDQAWTRNYEEAKRYFEAHGNLNTNVNEIASNGVKLGAWICQLRTYRKSGIQTHYLTSKRIQQLDALNMIWDVPDYLWERNYVAAMEYYRRFGHLDVPHQYCSTESIQLGAWVRRMRGIRTGRVKGATLTEHQIERLDEIGMQWEDKFTRQWETSFQEAVVYFEEHGTLDIPTGYVSKSGHKLGAWIANHRDRSGIKVTPERRARLDAYGMIWTKADPWEARYALVKRYYETNGTLRIPSDYIENGIWLSKWLNEQRQIYLGKRKGKELNRDQIRRLEAISFDWLSMKERQAYRDRKLTIMQTNQLEQIDSKGKKYNDAERKSLAIFTDHAWERNEVHSGGI